MRNGTVQHRRFGDAVSAMEFVIRFPLECYQSAKVRTAIVLEMCKCKSQSSTCPRSFQLCCIYCDLWCIPWIWKGITAYSYTDRQPMAKINVTSHISSHTWSRSH